MRNYGGDCGDGEILGCVNDFLGYFLGDGARAGARTRRTPNTEKWR